MREEPIDYIFEHKFGVRDYECDLQGVVNNANYQHYFEHARNEFLKKIIGLNLAEQHARGVDFMVRRIEIDYKSPLRSGDEFVVKSGMEKVGVRWIFTQDIFLVGGDRLMARAKVTVVSVIKGRLKNCDEVDKAFFKILDARKKE